MARTLLVAAIGAVCWIGPLTAQDRPDFSGTWTLEPARSTPSGSGLFGTTFTATQDTDTLEIARAVTMGAAPLGGGAVRTSQRTWREVFRLNGEIWRDRVASPSRPRDLSWPPDEPVEPARVKVALLDSVTSAMWTGDQLVSITYRSSRLSAPDREPPEWVRRQTFRLTLALEPDGLLAVEALLIEDPSPWEPGRQEAPRVLRSVYRRDGATPAPPAQIEPGNGTRAMHEAAIAALTPEPPSLVVAARPIRMPAVTPGVWSGAFADAPAELTAAIERLAADEPDAPFSPDQFPASVRFRPKGEIEQQYRLLMMSGLTRPADVWPEFTKELGAQAWAAFSRVLATSDRRDAILYYEYWCGTLCGKGQLLWLHRDTATESWRVAGRATSWIS